MGNRKKLVLASLVSVMMMLSFAIGLVPSQLSGPPTSAKAAQGATAVAISADGVTAVGDKFSIPVGGEQSFTALSVTDGAATHLIPTGEAEWSLATDGSAALSAVKGDFVATVSALAPGEAGLYVSTGDGLTDLVNLTLYNLKGAKNNYGSLDSVTITHPRNNTTLLYQTGTTNIPWTLTAETNNPTNTASVNYKDETNTNFGSATTPPYAVTIPDVTALAPSATITALASSVVKYNSVSDTVNLTLEAVNADTNTDGLPDAPFLLNLALGEEWISSVTVNGEKRYVHVAGLGTGTGAKAIDIPSNGVTVTIADPTDATRVVTVTVPAGLLTAGQSGVLVVEASNTVSSLLGPAQAANVKPDPAGGLVAGGQYVEVGILVSSDNGVTFTEINPTQLEDHPVTLEMFMAGVLSGDDNVRFFAYPTNITNGSPIGVTANASGAWTQTANGTQVQAGKLTTELTSLSLIAPFATPNALRILSVTNTGVDTNTTGAKDYSIGGGSLDVVLANKPAGAVVVTIDGKVAAQSKVVSNKVTITAPSANALTTAATSAKVDIRVADAADATSFDASPKGFTYVGPVISTVSPASGTESGNQSITITGKGFSASPTVDLGGAAVTSAAASGSTSITGTTGAHTPGKVAATVTLSNKYKGTTDGAYTYTPEDPILSSVFPVNAYNDGGYSIRANGKHFVNPNTVFKANAVTRGFFTKTLDSAAPNVDNQAIEVEFIDDSRLNVVTPVVTSVGLYNIYVATELYTTKAQQLSNLKPFQFLDSLSAPMKITSVVPNSGSINGGNTVAILGQGFPVGGSGGDVTSGHVIRVANGFAATGAVASVPVSLFRGTDASPTHPASLKLTFSFDSAVLTAHDTGKTDPAFVGDAKLATWYGKSASSSHTVAGQISIVVSGGTTEITTFNDQVAGGTPSEQNNPFVLGVLKFDVAGATGASTNINVTTISLSDSAATAITDGKGQSGFFNVGTSAATRPPADVYFGATKATLDTTAAAGTAARIYAIAPKGERADKKVDVRVQDPADATLFAVSRANALYGKGGGYLYKAGLTIDSVTPNESWAFGGTIAHIKGAQFEYTAKSVTQVYFGSVLADYAPAPYVNTASDLYVIVPELPSPAASLNPATLAVDVTVKNSTNETVVKDNAFTYNLFHKQTESYGVASGVVYTTGFYFPTATGTGATGQKVSLSDDATTAATVIVPAATAGKTSSGLTYALVRATKTPQLFGVQNLPGTAIPNVWNFDIHLYDGNYKFDELNVTYNTGQTPITLRYPTDDTTLPLATNSGTLSTYSHDSSFVYDYPAGDSTVDTTSARYQSNVLPSEEVVSGANIREVTTRLYHLSASALRAGVKPPVITCTLDGGPRRVKEGDTVDLSGQGLGWVRSIQVLTDSNVTSKSIADVLAGNITSDEFNASFKFPKYTANVDGAAQLKVTINDGTAGGVVKYVNGLTVKATVTPTTNNGWLQILFGLLAALLGLAAGGNHGGGGGGPCFIATAAYGTPMADQIDTLRDFRDVYLLSNSVGSAFVDVYYHVSPAVADVVAKSPVLATVVRMVLVPVIVLAKMALAMPVVTFALTLLSGLAMYLRRAKKATKA